MPRHHALGRRSVLQRSPINTLCLGTEHLHQHTKNTAHQRPPNAYWQHCACASPHPPHCDGLVGTRHSGVAHPPPPGWNARMSPLPT